MPDSLPLLHSSPAPPSFRPLQTHFAITLRAQFCRTIIENGENTLLKVKHHHQNSISS